MNAEVLNCCWLCRNGHGELVCDCGLRHDEHVFAVGARKRKDMKRACDGYSQQLLNTHHGVDKRKEGPA